jgi:hypothetical protein
VLTPAAIRALPERKVIVNNLLKRQPRLGLGLGFVVRRIAAKTHFVVMLLSCIPRSHSIHRSKRAERHPVLPTIAPILEYPLAGTAGSQPQAEARQIVIEDQ